MDKLELAIDTYLEGNINKSIKLLNECISEGSCDLGKAFYYLGLCYANENKLTFSCDVLQKAVELDSSKSLYHYKLGDVYSRLMIFDKAIEELTTTITLNPEHIRAKYQLGLLYFKKGDIENSVLIFKSLIKLSPDFASSYYHLGLGYFYMGKNNEAKESLYKAIELNPNYDEANVKLAEILSNEGDTQEALRISEQIYANGLRTYPFLKFYITEIKKSDDLLTLKKVLEETRILYPHNSEIEDEV